MKYRIALICTGTISLQYIDNYVTAPASSQILGIGNWCSVVDLCLMVANLSMDKWYVLHCDSKVAIALATGEYRPDANRDLVTLARALLDEIRSTAKVRMNLCLKKV